MCHGEIFAIFSAILRNITLFSGNSFKVGL